MIVSLAKATEHVWLAVHLTLECWIQSPCVVYLWRVTMIFSAKQPLNALLTVLRVNLALSALSVLQTIILL